MESANEIILSVSLILNKGLILSIGYKSKDNSILRNKII